MIYNKILGKKGICRAMAEHTAARIALSSKLRYIGKRFGFIYVKLFGYPPAPASRILARKTLRFLRKNGRGLLLDVGCSHGTYSFELARLGYTVVGIDVNRESIQLAQKIQDYLGLKNLTFHEMNILSNNFSENIFDVIIIFETLEHIKEDSKVIQEFNRILKDNGILMISVPFAKNIEECDEPQGACRTKEGSYVCIGEGGSHYRNGYDLNRIQTLLEKNGFVLISWEYLSIPKLLESSILSFPFKYPLSLLFTHFSKNRIELKVIAQKASSQV